ncbi:MAG: DUF4389 domain-containing protein [Gammaproteobacteria bacterium]|nr:DUF4389 domain-containing protein [Gammaproteobacteria bacterium]
MGEEVKENLKRQSTWVRGLYMLLFAIFYSVAEIVMFAIVIFQFIHKLIKGDTNARLMELGQSLATYIYQIIQYLTFNSNYQVYPFGAWPKGEPSELKKLEDS